jgi:hypothetical protein
MPLSTLAQIVILIGTTILQALLQPRIKRGRAPDLDIPDAEEGKPVPVVYGLQAVGLNLIGVGDITADDDDNPAHPPKFYTALMQGSVCLGPITEVVDIQFGGKSLRLHPFTKDDTSSGGTATVQVSTGTPTDPALPYSGTFPVTFDINARQLFGGAAEEGGVENHLRIHSGALDQTVDAVTTHLWQTAGLDGDGSAYPGLCYVTFGEVGTEFYFGKVPQPQTPVLLIKVIPDALGFGAIGNDANPAEILFDILTHRLRGLGLDPAVWIDGDSFVEAGNTLLAEGLGLSFTFKDQQDAWDSKTDIERHIQGGLFQHPTTALWTMSLARPVTPTETVSRSTASDLQVTRPSWRDTANEIKLTYRRYDDSPLEGAVIVGEALATDITFLVLAGTYLGGQTLVAYAQTKGTDISNVVVHNTTKSIDLVEGTHYTRTDNWFTFVPVTGELDAGDDLTVDYTNGSALVGYREATVQAQDLANQQATGEVRSEAYEYPGFTKEANAQIHVGRLLRLRAKPLATATWTETRGAESPDRQRGGRG